METTLPDFNMYMCRWNLCVIVIEHAFLILQAEGENLVTLDDTNASAVLQKDGTVVCTHEILSPIGNVILTHYWLHSGRDA